MKTPYEVTDADKQTGKNLRRLRRHHGESMAETIQRSGLKMSLTCMSNTELGRRALTLPEATKLAAHFNTTVERLMHQPAPAAVSEQAWLGNEPALFAVPDPADTVAAEYVIDLTNPLTPDEYREQVWIPYLEYRYQTDQRAS